MRTIYTLKEAREAAEIYRGSERGWAIQVVIDRYDDNRETLDNPSPTHDAGIGSKCQHYIDQAHDRLKKLFGIEIEGIYCPFIQLSYWMVDLSGQPFTRQWLVRVITSQASL